MNDKIPHFLIIDDDEVTREELCSILTALECSCEFARSIEDVIENLSKLNQPLKYEAIFIEQLLSGLNSSELITKLKNNPYTKSIPKIMLSSNSTVRDLILGYNAGADYYITKPFDQEQIEYAFDILLANSKDEIHVINLDEI